MKQSVVEGFFFDAQTSRCREVILRYAAGQVIVDTRDRGKRIIAEQVNAVEIEAPVAGLPRRIRFPGGGVFETHDRDGFVSLLSGEAGAKVRRYGLHGLSPARWVALIVLSICLPVVIWFGYPLAADRIALALPVETDRLIGTSMLETLDGSLFDPSELSLRRQAELQTLFQPLAESIGVEAGAVRLVFRKSDGLGANALALPDGTVILLDGLVDLAKHDDELAAVLAHEIGHVYHRHAIRKVVRAAGITVLTSMLLGDTSSLLEEIVVAGAGLSELAFSREFETEADIVAAESMRKLGKDPQALVTLLRRIDKKCGEDCEETGLFSTHPGLRDRLEVLNQ